MTFRIQVDVLDCLGCGNCADVCPGNPKKGGKALTMKHLESQLPEAANWTYCAENVKSKQHLVDIKANVKNSQFATPLFEFSGACSGCGETPYVKLISQLFGDREMVANATGCSSIYSGSVPSTPYTKNEKGHGPAWANSLFEDFCEFGLGMELANEKMRARIVKAMEDAIAAEGTPAEYKEVFQAWIENMYDADKTKELAPQVKAVIEEGLSHGCPICKELKDKGYSELVQRKTGLLIDPYFLASGAKWILDNVENARELAEKGDLLMGTIDSWLIWKLTEGRNHLTDYTNASRTMLFNIHTLDWDEELLKLFTIPRSMMPEALPCDAIFGETTIEGLFKSPIQIAGV